MKQPDLTIGGLIFAFSGLVFLLLTASGISTFAIFLVSTVGLVICCLGVLLLLIMPNTNISALGFLVLTRDLLAGIVLWSAIALSLNMNWNTI